MPDYHSPGLTPTRLDELPGWLQEAETRFGSLTTAVAGLTAAVGSLTDRVAALEAAPAPTPTPTPVPQPVPPNALNVRDFGAKGNGTTNDQPAIQTALDRALTGQTVYLPAGRYRITTPLTLTMGGVTVMGDGDGSVIHHGTLRGLQVTGALSGVVIRQLKLLGAPGQFDKSHGHNQHAILFNGTQGAVVQDVLLEGPGSGVYSIGTTFGTRIERVRVAGWGRTAFGVQGGEQITGCTLTQNDPGRNSEHGMYIYSGAKDVLVADTTIENGRYFALHVYGEGNPIDRLTFRRVTVRNCHDGLILMGWPAGGALARTILVEGCLFSQVTGGPALSIKQGDGITLRDNRLEQCNIGLGLGRWASSETNYRVRNLTATGNTFAGCGTAVVASATAGGRFENCVVGPNTYTGNAKDKEESAGSGILWR